MSLLSSIQGFGQQFLRDPNGAATQAPVEMKDIEAFADQLRVNDATGVIPESITKVDAAPTFGTKTFDPAEGIQGMVEGVDAAMKAGRGKAHEVLAGESDNLHQSMIAMQEAGVAFNLMLEVRNKMVESYQELMRMSV
ncbi:MAG: flagellar hook-basal body complex protein FliE [Verrucomicrobiota bacterium]